jgi:hypothetical protein
MGMNQSDFTDVHFVANVGDDTCRACGDVSTTRSGLTGRKRADAAISHDSKKKPINF